MTWTMSQSPARRTFKRLAGNANHFLITILVGLDAVSDGRAKKAESFPTTWEPHDAAASAARSSEFARKALVSWLVDALDAYLLAIVRRRPALEQAPGDDWPNIKKSVFKKSVWAADRYELLETPEFGLTIATIVWRNRLVHYEAANPVPSDVLDVLTTHAGQIASKYQGLDIELMIEHLHDSAAPRFKEVTSLVRAVHGFVQQVDSVLIERLDWSLYFDEGLRAYLADGDSVMRVANVWGKDRDKRANTLRQLATAMGLSKASNPDAEDGLNADALTTYETMSHAEARLAFLDG